MRWNRVCDCVFCVAITVVFCYCLWQTSLVRASHKEIISPSSKHRLCLPRFSILMYIVPRYQRYRVLWRLKLPPSVKIDPSSKNLYHVRLNRLVLNCTKKLETHLQIDVCWIGLLFLLPLSWKFCFCLGSFISSSSRITQTVEDYFHKFFEVQCSRPLDKKQLIKF